MYASSVRHRRVARPQVTLWLSRPATSRFDLGPKFY